MKTLVTHDDYLRAAEEAEQSGDHYGSEMLRKMATDLAPPKQPSDRAPERRAPSRSIPRHR